MKNILISFKSIFQEFNCIYEMVGRPRVGRMNEMGRPTFHEFVSVSSNIHYKLA